MGIQKDTLTGEQKREVERLRQFVSRNRLNVHMNSTKWRAAIDAVMAIPGYKASFRVKRIIDAGEPPVDAWDENFPGNIPLYNSIEWLELNPAGPWTTGAGSKPKRPDLTETLKRELEAVQIRVAVTESGVRIIAHSRGTK